MRRVLSRWGRFVTNTLSRTLSHTSRITGKLRPNKRQVRQDRREQLLSQSLAEVTAERDRLILECDRLTTERDQLLQERHHFSSECDRLEREARKAKEDAQEFAQYAEEIEQTQHHLSQENADLHQQIAQLHQEKAVLVEDNEAYQREVVDLEQQLSEMNAYLAEHRTNGSVDVSSQPAPPRLDLSGYSVALVGGHPTTRQGVLQELANTYGLNMRNCVEIPPFTEASTSSSKVRAKISRCDLVVIITGYMGHGLTQIVYDLKNAGAIAGEVMMLNCRGKSGVVREILQYFQNTGRGSESPQGT